MQQLSRRLCRDGGLLHHAYSNSTRDALRLRFFDCFPQRAVSTAAQEATAIVTDHGANVIEETDGLPPNVAVSRLRPKQTSKPSPRARAKRSKGKPSQPRFTADNQRYFVKEQATTGDKAWRPVHDSPPYLTKDELETLVGLLNPKFEQLQKEEFHRAKNRRRRTVNREYLLEKGSLAYDWRVPLAKLQRFTKPMSDERAPKSDMQSEEEALLRLTRERSRAYVSVRVDEIDVPRQWNRETVAQYVFDLTRSRMPTAHSTVLYGREQSHREAVMERLMEIFEDAAVRPHLSHTAFHSAMRWLHASSYVNLSRRLFFTMADFKMAPSRETFHIMLADIAGKKNLHAFSCLLQGMLNRLIDPDARTWYWFFRCVDSKLVKQLILDNMEGLGLLRDVHVLRAATTELVPRDVMAHVENGGKVSEVVQEYDHRYGRRWFCTSAVNAIGHTFALNGRFQSTPDLLLLMSNRHLRPDRTTLESLLKGYRAAGARYQEGGIYGAVETLRLFKEKYDVDADARCFDILLKMGWQLNRPNFCRAVWRVACLKAQITSDMCVRIMKSLTFRAAEEPGELTRFPHFWSYPAKIIAGIDDGDEQCAAAWRILRGKGASPKEAEEDKEVTRAARLIRDADLRSSFKHDYDGNFSALLRSALDIDKDWLRREECKMGDVDWMLQNAVRVPVAVRSVDATPDDENELLL